MNRRLESIQKQSRSDTKAGPQAELHDLLDRLQRRDRVIGSLTPEQWRSVASRVPPAHGKVRDALSRISQLAAEVQQERGEEAVAADPDASDGVPESRQAGPAERSRLPCYSMS